MWTDVFLYWQYFSANFKKKHETKIEIVKSTVLSKAFHTFMIPACICLLCIAKKYDFVLTIHIFYFKKIFTSFYTILWETCIDSVFPHGIRKCNCFWPYLSKLLLKMMNPWKLRGVDNTQRILVMLRLCYIH